jgi:hypothetical protein
MRERAGKGPGGQEHQLTSLVHCTDTSFTLHDQGTCQTFIKFIILEWMYATGLATESYDHNDYSTSCIMREKKQGTEAWPTRWFSCQGPLRWA